MVHVIIHIVSAHLAKFPLAVNLKRRITQRGGSQAAYNPLTWLGRRKYRKVKELAERTRVKVGTAFARTHPEKVKELARELRVTEAEIRRRTMRRGSPESI
jgi:hypothetical protein